MTRKTIEAQLAEAAAIDDPVVQARTYHRIMSEIDEIAQQASQGRDVALKKANLLGQSYGALADVLGVSKALVQQRVVAGAKLLRHKVA